MRLTAASPRRIARTMLTLLVLAGFVCASAAMSLQDARAEVDRRIAQLHFPGIPDDGVVNPSLVHTRLRRSLFKDPFYQWWYFWVRDNAGNHFAVCYCMQTAGSNAGGFVLFSKVLQDRSRNSVRWDRFDLATLSGGSAAPLFMNITIGGPANAILPLGNDTYRITGHLPAAATHVWQCDGDCQGDVQWDLTLSRRHGWYGQAGLISELNRKLSVGITQWNTYGHDCVVKGSVRMGSETYTATSDVWRGYADMNWGSRFPTPPSSPRPSASAPPRHAAAAAPASDYAWGWYSAHDEATGASFIAGLGLGETGFPYYSIFGGFADIVINATLRVGFRRMTILFDTPVSTTIATCSDTTTTHVFNVTRTDWVAMRGLPVPLTQALVIQSDHYLVRMVFTSTAAVYNRILFPYANTSFTDWEALGATAHCTVQYSPSRWRRADDAVVVADFVDNNAGLEYGRLYNS